MMIIISYSVRLSFGLRVLVNCDLLVMVMILLYPLGRWARLGFSNLSPSAGGAVLRFCCSPHADSSTENYYCEDDILSNGY